MRTSGRTGCLLRSAVVSIPPSRTRIVDIEALKEKDSSLHSSTSSPSVTHDLDLSEFPLSKLYSYRYLNSHIRLRPPNLEGLQVSGFVDSETDYSTSSTPLFQGKVKRHIMHSLYSVSLPKKAMLSPVIEVGCRVFVKNVDDYSSMGADDEVEDFSNLVGGIVVRMNGSGTASVIFDNNRIDLALPTSRIVLNFGRALLQRQKDYLDIVEWIRTSGVVRRLEQEGMAAVLYSRGWRVNKLYLLEAADVHCMTFVSKSVRMCVLDKSESQREHHRQMRLLLKERVKEKDFRYRLTKYSGVISASMAFLGIAIAFAWNLKNYRYQQRKYQLSFAVERLTESSQYHRKAAPSLEEMAAATSTEIPLGAASEGNDPHGSATSSTATGDGAVHSETNASSSSAPSSPIYKLHRHRRGDEEDEGAQLRHRHFVKRDKEEQMVRQVVEQLDTSHPRIVVLTGVYGCGKSTVCKAAIKQLNKNAVHVDIRGNEDVLQSIVKALGVPNLDVCGDLLDFIAEACKESKRISGETPLLVLKLRGQVNLLRGYNDSVALACDRRVCHLIIEAPLESLTLANSSLPRLDYYSVPIFSVSQAVDYTQHRVDPVSLMHFIEVVGTNTNDLDELFAAVNQRAVVPSVYTSQKLTKAMRLLQAACTNQPVLRTALHQLASFPYEVGQHAGVDSTSLRSPQLKEIVLYDAVNDRWMFRSKVLHTATLSCWGVGKHEP